MSEFESSNRSAAGLGARAARPTGRRAFVKGMAAAVAAAGAGAMLPHAAAAAERGKQAAAPFPFPLPPVGVEIPCSMYASNVPLRLDILGALALDFKGGINYLVTKADENGADSEVQGFRVEADLSPTTPNNGTIVVITHSGEATAPSTLRMGASGGAEMVTRLPAVLSTIDKATGEETMAGWADPAQPFALVSRDMQTFPPVNQLHELQNPVPLLDSSGNRTGSLDGFSAVMNQSA